MSSYTDYVKDENDNYILDQSGKKYHILSSLNQWMIGLN